MPIDIIPPGRSPKRRVYSIWTVLATLLIVFAGFAMFVVWFINQHASETSRLRRELEAVQNEQKQADILRQKAAVGDQLALARTRQQEVLVHARNATNQIEQLRVEINRLTNEVAAIKLNDTGRAIAQHPDLTAQARRFYETELAQLPSSAEIITRLEAARRVEQQVLASEGTSNILQPDLAVTAQNAGVWAEQTRQKVSQLQTILSTLVQESKIKVTLAPLTANSPTLDVAMAELTRAELAFRQQTIVTNTAVAKTKAVDTVAGAEVTNILEQARIEAAKILQKANEDAAKLRRESEQKAAEAKILDSQSKVAVLQKEDEARKVQLRQKASDPAIQAKLAPFTTPGYLKLPGMIEPNKAPHSYTQLKVAGALEPTMDGMQHMVNVAYSRLDKVRPRWTFRRSGSTGWRNNPSEIEMVKDVQQLLIELGPVLVELGQLAP